VLGLAVSFGAQSLVKDVISGTFMLLEGQFGIGDVISVGDASGAVEKITLRTTVLRDIRGAVHIIPNGEITRVTNLTKAWSRAVLDIGVGYPEDADRVMAVMKEEADGLQADPQWGELLLDPPEVLGIETFGESAMVIRLLARTLPEKQWNVARELRRRIKKRFDAEGIELPFPHVTVYWGEGQDPRLVGRPGPES
jgi:small conductance mechanosensitive channel